MAQIDTLTNVGAVVSTDLALILRGGANVLGTFGTLVGQNASAVAITGGLITGTALNGALGATTPASVAATTLTTTGTATFAGNILFDTTGGAGALSIGMVNDFDLKLANSRGANNSITIGDTTLDFVGAATFSAGVSVTANDLSDGLIVSGNDNANAKIRIHNTGAGGSNFSLLAGIVGASNGGLTIYDHDRAASVAYFDASGNLLVGKASGDTSITANSTTIANNEQAALICTAAGRSANIAVYKHAGISNAVAYLYLAEDDGGGNYIWMDNSSIMKTSPTASNIGTTTGTAIGDQTSDERLKNIDHAFGYGLSDVMALVPIRYTRNDEIDSPVRLGFGAQTTQGVIPEAVYNTGECLDGYTVDPDNHMIQAPKSERTKLAMQYVQIVPVLVKAMQEQQTMIVELQAQVAALSA